MAFKMNRSVIKGTPLHKASIAKAKSDSIVAQTRTTPESSLVTAAGALGESYIPALIDFSIHKRGFKLPKAEDKNTGNSSRTKKRVKTKKDKKKEANIDKSNDKTATKIEGAEKVKVEEKEPVKAKPIDILVGDKERADAKYIAPYVEEAEDEDDDFSYIENDNSGSTESSANTKNKPYRNWKRRQEEENIAAAEATKKRLDDASRKREEEAVSKGELDTRLTEAEVGGEEEDDFSYIENEPTIESKKAEEYKSPEAGTKEAEELSLRQKKASRKRTDANSLDIEPKEAELLPSAKTEVELKQAGKAPKPKAKIPKAHDNPKYKIKQPKRDSEGNLISMGGSTSSPGYSYEEESDQWSYNGRPIEQYEVPEEFVDSQDEQNQERDDRVMNQNLNSNTPSTKSTAVEPLPQPQPQSQSQPVVEEPTTTALDRKPRPSDFEGSFKEKQVQYKIANEKWWKAQQAEKGKSAVKMRDDRIYRNARADGPIRRNMIDGGYTPR